MVCFFRARVLSYVAYRHPGQHNDARMNVALIMTAVKLGATVANYCGVTELHKNAQGKLVGVKVKDELTGREFNVRARVSQPSLSFPTRFRRVLTSQDRASSMRLARTPTRSSRSTIPHISPS